MKSTAIQFVRLLWGGDQDEGLPARVQEAVRVQDDRSERLIGWMQLTLVILFSALYVTAPKTHMDTWLTSPVPMALSLYALFTMIRVYVSHKISLPDWYLGLSGAVDIALLMTLIWSFHIQYGQPAAFYLKAPTMLYVFIFIALRALRFQPRYVLRTGLAAALGWSVLLIYALHGDTSSMPLTRDYVEYLTDNRVLLGGEIDKILTIVVVTFLLTLAQIRARNTLLKGIEEGQAHAELSRFFAPEIAEKIARGEAESGTGEEVTASVLYIDIRDFTALSERIPPGALMSMLADYQSRMVPIIAAHGGTVERFTGDGVMASFGAAKAQTDYARRALDAAKAIVEEAGNWADAREQAGQETLRIGLAVTTGRLIIGAVGGGGKFEYTMVGEPANRAAKLEKMNKDFRTTAIADKQTVNAARMQGWAGELVEERRAVKVADIDTPCDLCILV